MGLSVKLKKKVNGFKLDVTWEIGNELAVLFGFSGAGKSITLQIIAGLLTPDDGFIRIDNTTMFDSSKRINVPSQKRHLGYVFQDLALFPHMTALDNILYGSISMGKSERRERAREMIGAFHIEGTERKYPAELSGGQKQRVAFARALGEFGATLMVAGNISGKTDTVPLAIYSLAGGGEWSKATLMVIFFTVLSGLFIYIANKLNKRII